MPNRRWIRVFTVVLLLALGLWSFWLEPASLRVQTVDIPVDWPYVRPLRVALVSDLHVGAPYHGLARLPSTVDRINATTPDLIFIAGDVVTLGVLGGQFTTPEAIAQELRRLRAPSGVFAVLGNHDRLFSALRVRVALEAAGIRVLEDTASLVDTPSGRVWVAGLTDFWTGPHNLGRTLAAVTDTTTPVLLLTHNPDVFPRIPPRVMLTLAGHTHGGQVRLPLIGSPIVPSRYGQRYVRGLVIEGNRRLFVSTGIGTSDLPIRLGVPPTIFVLSLHAAARP
jgi:predicted MPP superfamily phosphohydrolase